MVSQHFGLCTFTPVVGADSSSSLTASSSGTWKTSSFYFDSSGRSTISLPLELKFPSKQALDEFIAADCIQPPPSNLIPGEAATAADKEEEAGPDTTKKETDTSSSKWSLGIEAKVTLTFGTGEAIAATVEDISVLSTTVQGQSVYLDAEIVVRVSRAGGERLEANDESRVKTNLEVSAVLSENIEGIDEDSVALQGLRTLNLGGFPDLGKTSLHRRVKQNKLAPFALNVALTHAMSIAVKSVDTQTMGKTLVSLTTRHSNTHTESVTITNIALHPGHSRQDAVIIEGGAGGAQNVLDMTKSFQWGFAQRSDVNLPLTLGPHEAFSTIITVDAPNDFRARTFYSPISVTAVVGRRDEGLRNSSSHRYNVVAATNVQWRTTRAAVEPADAFRVDMTLQNIECTVGAPLTLSLEIANLSSEERDLTLMVDHKSQSTIPDLGADEDLSLVSNKGGQSFGVLGLFTDDQDATNRNDHELLAVDVALLLGEIKGHESTIVELRFIPLREGTLAVPFLKLVDEKSGRWYNCVHNLRIVAKLSGTM